MFHLFSWNHVMSFNWLRCAALSVALWPCGTLCCIRCRTRQFSRTTNWNHSCGDTIEMRRWTSFYPESQSLGKTRCHDFLKKLEHLMQASSRRISLNFPATLCKVWMMGRSLWTSEGSKNPSLGANEVKQREISSDLWWLSCDGHHSVFLCSATAPRYGLCPG